MQHIQEALMNLTKSLCCFAFFKTFVKILRSIFGRPKITKAKDPKNKVPK